MYYIVSSCLPLCLFYSIHISKNRTEQTTKEKDYDVLYCFLDVDFGLRLYYSLYYSIGMNSCELLVGAGLLLQRNEKMLTFFCNFFCFLRKVTTLYTCNYTYFKRKKESR